MVLPVVVLGDAFQRVEDAGVVLVVELVDGRSVVLRQTVVDPLLRLHDAWLSSGLEELDEEVLHVLVGEELIGRHHVALVFRLPVELVCG